MELGEVELRVLRFLSDKMWTNPKTLRHTFGPKVIDSLIKRGLVSKIEDGSIRISLSGRQILQ